MKVLLIDEDAGARAVTMRALSHLPEVQVIEEDDSGDAMEIVAQNPPDLVVVDWVLGEILSGAEVVEYLHAVGVPVVIASIFQFPDAGVRFVDRNQDFEAFKHALSEAVKDVGLCEPAVAAS